MKAEKLHDHYPTGLFFKILVENETWRLLVSHWPPSSRCLPPRTTLVTAVCHAPVRIRLSQVRPRTAYPSAPLLCGLNLSDNSAYPNICLQLVEFIKSNNHYCILLDMLFVDVISFAWHCILELLVISGLDRMFYTLNWFVKGASRAPRPYGGVPQAIQYALDEMIQPVPELESDCE